MRTKLYNRAAATAYARKWALGRNPYFYDFSALGGDCTNFISQCIYAGAGVMNYTPDTGWYYRSVADRAAAWTGVEYLYKFLINNNSVGPYANEVSKNEAQIGDIVQLGTGDGKFYHSLMIVQTAPQILICAHTYDALNRPLSSYSFAKTRFLHINGVRYY